MKIRLFALAAGLAMAVIPAPSKAVTHIVGPIDPCSLITPAELAPILGGASVAEGPRAHELACDFSAPTGGGRTVGSIMIFGPSSRSPRIGGRSPLMAFKSLQRTGDEGCMKSLGFLNETECAHAHSSLFLYKHGTLYAIYVGRMTAQPEGGMHLAYGSEVESAEFAIARNLLRGYLP